MKNGLIITADDYGLSDGVNGAVLKAIELGAITSVQCLVNLCSENDLKKLKEAIEASDYNCGIGLHFNTTVGPSMTQKSSNMTYKPDGQNNAREMFYHIHDFNYDKVSYWDVYYEAVEQFEYLGDTVGYENIDSISSHYNLHLFSKPYLKALLKLGSKHKIPFRSTVQWRTKQRPKTKSYPGKRPMPIFRDGILTYLSCRIDSTRELLRTAGCGKKLHQLRKICRKNGCATPVNTTAHWHGQPDPYCLSWIHHQLNSIKKNRTYVTEMFMHLSNSNEWNGPKLRHSMEDRKEEYETVISEEYLNEILEIRRNDKVNLGTYKECLGLN